MKRKLTSLSQHYAAALRAQMRQGSRANLLPAYEWGCQAAALGLETIDVARMHEGAIAALEATGSREGFLKQATLFFTEAIIPIEETHAAALRSKVRMRQLRQTLGQRTRELAASNRSLEKGILRRQHLQQALKKSRDHSRKILRESHDLQKHLQRLTHQILSAQEDKRKLISHELQDEIAQSLLGINIRLMTLKRAAAVNAHGLKKEIVSTRRLVDKSMKSINRFACEFGTHTKP